MSSDRRLFHLVSNVADWTISGLVTPPLRVLTRRCEAALLPYGRNFCGRSKSVVHGGLKATYLSVPAWLRRLFENPKTLALAYTLAIPALAFEAARHVRRVDPDI